MLKVISLNLNGIRSASRKGLLPWLEEQSADIICLQEIKARPADLEKDAQFWPEGYHCRYVCAEKPGYSGVAIYARKPPDSVREGIGWPRLDSEGRYLEYAFGQYRFASIYLPSGSSGPERQAVKFNFLEHYSEFLRACSASGHSYVLSGDWNIAHKAIDLKNWRGNQKNSGFLPEERAWMDELFGPAGWVDAFRTLNQDADQYTWWSNRGQAWAKNVGWRIDYQVVSADLADKVRSVSIYKEQRFSDHAPLIIEYDIEL